MDGISMISSRIMEIEARFSTFAPTQPHATPSATQSSFDQVLNLAVADTAAATNVPAAQDISPAAAAWAPGGVPADLAHYGNGKVPSDALMQLSGSSHKLWEPAGQAFEQLRASAAADGVKIGINDAYRSYPDQVDMAERKGLYINGGLAAVPGTSDHGWGTALDLSLDSQAQSWMQSNAKKFGFVDSTPREPWHWVYTK